MSTSTLTQDQAFVAEGANEELAGPPHLTAPVGRQERISGIDALRGFALLGILLMNMPSFAYPTFDAWIPYQMVHPVFSGPHWHVNAGIWASRIIFADGKMRGLFSLLYGAGALLLLDRAEKRGAGIRSADIFLRRNLWITLFGLIHCYLIWFGDILFYYGMFALLFVFPLRVLRARTLLITSIVLFVLNITVGSEVFYHPMRTVRQHRAASEAYDARAAHRQLSADQAEAIRTWEARLAKTPTAKQLYDSIADHQKGYVATRIADAPESYELQTKFQAPGWGDWGTMIVLGMALYRYGFLTGKWSRRAYATMAAIGLGISLPLSAWYTWYMWRGGFDPMHRLPGDVFFDIARVSGTLGNAALLLLFMHLGWFRVAFRLLGNVGQTALSNYILTSVVMQIIFVWSPLHWFGYLELYQAYAIVVAMWVVNLLLSFFWLRHFQFGPLEWAWRSLTYWKKQPMLLRHET